VDAGFNAIDTADVYMAMMPGMSGGESEAILGRWLARRGRRDDLVLMTKVGLWEQHKGLSAATIAAAVEDSLRRLKTDYIDVYFAHFDDKETPLQETLEAFTRLVKAGKVRCAGASNYSGERLAEALALAQTGSLARYEVVQPLYNLMERDTFEHDLSGLLRDQDIGAVCYFGLASGFLTGKYRTVADLGNSSRGEFIRKYLDARGECVLSALDEVALESQATPAQVALAWLMHKPSVTAPIASATSLVQLEDILQAADLTLSRDMMAKLDAAGL